MIEHVEIGGVRLDLSQADNSPGEWIGQREVLKQLLACWLVVDEKDQPLAPRIVGAPGIGKTTLAVAAGRVRQQELYIYQCTADTRPEDLLVTPVLAEDGRIKYHASPLVTAMVRGGICILDGEACEVQGVGFAGVKGFPGGFGSRVLAPWGEPSIKQFVHEAVEESLKLESALARLRTRSRIALLHYAPIAATVMGEPLEISPFLGCSRLEEPINRYPVAAVFHGHAHNGTPEGTTSSGIPVYNVALKLLEKTFPGKPPCRIIDVPSGTEPQAEIAQPPTPG